MAEDRCAPRSIHAQRAEHNNAPCSCRTWRLDQTRHFARTQNTLFGEQGVGKSLPRKLGTVQLAWTQSTCRLRTVSLPLRPRRSHHHWERLGTFRRPSCRSSNTWKRVIVSDTRAVCAGVRSKPATQIVMQCNWRTQGCTRCKLSCQTCFEIVRGCKVCTQQTPAMARIDQHYRLCTVWQLFQLHTYVNGRAKYPRDKTKPGETSKQK